MTVGEDINAPAGEGRTEFYTSTIRALAMENDILRKENRALRMELESYRERVDDMDSEGRSKDETIRSLQEENRSCVHKLTMNSRNSSLPPSMDRMWRARPRSLRVPTGLKPGAQKGHKGVAPEIPHEPDEIVEHLPQVCLDCPRLAECSGNGLFQCSGRRYVVEAVTTTRVVEHRTMRASCPHGDPSMNGTAVMGSFPEGVSAHVQYGDSFKIIVGLLDCIGAVGDKRISDLVDSFFDVKLSPGTVVKMTRECSEVVDPAVERIRTMITESPVVNFDESGANVQGENAWIHTASTTLLTHLHLSRFRGEYGAREGGVIQFFKGTAVHDCFRSYWRFDNIGKHAVCGAHLLRELTAIEDTVPEHTWARTMREFLLAVKSMRDEAASRGLKSLSEARLDGLSKRYDEILDIADMQCPRPRTPRKVGSGRNALGKERALLERLRNLKSEVMLHAYDFQVPFDNNQAERDIRFNKTKIKVSGCFRTRSGAAQYLKLTSYLSTCRKNGIGPYEGLTMAFEGRPFIPRLSESDRLL